MTSLDFHMAKKKKKAKAAAANKVGNSSPVDIGSVSNTISSMIGPFIFCLVIFGAWYLYSKGYVNESVLAKYLDQYFVMEGGEYRVKGHPADRYKVLLHRDFSTIKMEEKARDPVKIDAAFTGNEILDSASSDGRMSWIPAETKVVLIEQKSPACKVKVKGTVKNGWILHDWLVVGNATESNGSKNAVFQKY